MYRMLGTGKQVGVERRKWEVDKVEVVYKRQKNFKLEQNFKLPSNNWIYVCC